MARKRAIESERLFVDARPDLGIPVIKSVQRVIELLELFSDLRIGLTVADVASRLKMPQSSASALLRSLYTLGYLTIDEARRTYLPSSRVPLLGYWVDPMLVCEGPMIRMARTIANQSGFSTFLASRNKLFVQVIYRHNPTETDLQSLTGAGSFLALSATGQVLMSDMSVREVNKIVLATNAQLPSGVSSVNHRELLTRLSAVRQQGYATAPSQRSPDKFTISVRLPTLTVEPMTFGINVPMGDFERNGYELIEMMKRSVRELADMTSSQE